MLIKETKIQGCFEISPIKHKDSRGSFIKVFNSEIFTAHGFDTDFKENYFSISQKSVVRGMHFQLPPKDYSKLVYVSKGEILDVVLDIRKSSGGYGKFITNNLSAENGKTLYIPKGCAHGFLSLDNDTIVTYLQTEVYSKEFDSGIRWDSFGMKWGLDNPIVSKRDVALKTFKDFVSLF
ncbi:MAG: dTDP-4-dehydrorhamnose 3,5-epimerase [Elusimicrobia bacterium]|nr:dTDP-4-dehydrorhamnose 3,5-epimerase [Elusimicrobiota bacterium]